jgi:cell wall-associated NlpC family hydrolase
MAAPVASGAARLLLPLLPEARRLALGLAAISVLGLAAGAAGVTALLGAVLATMPADADASPPGAGLVAQPGDGTASPAGSPFAVPPALAGEPAGQPVQASTAGLSLDTTSLGQAALALARREIGVPYVWGGADPRVGLDCSGLVQWVYRQLGVALPRTAQQQFNAAAPVAMSELRAGDLVFFARSYDDPHDWITHVGIYAGGGRMVNAPTTGEVVQEAPVFTGFWGAHYAGAGRIVAAGQGRSPPRERPDSPR